MNKKRVLNVLISLVLLAGFLPAHVAAQPAAAPTLLLVSNLVYTGPVSGDSDSLVTLSAVLTDETGAPLAGRAVYFSLGGLPPVFGISDGSGVASAELDLALAPGNYTLIVAFNGDSEYDPVSIEAALEVTSPWGSWIQDRPGGFRQPPECLD